MNVCELLQTSNLSISDFEDNTFESASCCFELVCSYVRKLSQCSGVGPVLFLMIFFWNSISVELCNSSSPESIVCVMAWDIILFN